MRDLLRLLAVFLGAVLVLASASSNPSGYAPAGPEVAPPPSASMAASAALGLWKSTFGAVKIELGAGTPGETRPVASPGQHHDELAGVWVYDRHGQEVVGYFSGPLDGNVLRFSWREPGPEGPLLGGGFLQFDANGQSFHGNWWTQDGTRRGVWTGWRHGIGQMPLADPAAPDSTAEPAPSASPPTSDSTIPFPAEPPPEGEDRAPTAPPPPPPGVGDAAQ